MRNISPLGVADAVGNFAQPSAGCADSSCRMSRPFIEGRVARYWAGRSSSACIGDSGAILQSIMRSALAPHDAQRDLGREIRIATVWSCPIQSEYGRRW